MQIKTKKHGDFYTTSHESDIVELTYGISGLRVIVETYCSEKDELVFIEYNFNVPRGFRFLNEGDLLRYWASEEFMQGYHLFEIVEGGWLKQEIKTPGMLEVTDTVGNFREWFIPTTSGCLNILSVNPPNIREID